MHELFSNATWGTISPTDDHHIVDNWKTEYTSIYINTFLFFVTNLALIALASTMPVPGGLIVPAFKIGAGLGRFFGECVAWAFPAGLNPYIDRTQFPLIVGGYAVAGSAGFAGGVTGALSSAVIAFETTGQLTHLLPVIITVIIANLVAQRLGPSVYDSLIKLKKLPYLPAIIPSSSNAHCIFVEDFMRKDVLYVWQGCTYRFLRHCLNSNRSIAVYPVVHNAHNLILMGTVERLELERLLADFLNRSHMTQPVKPALKRPGSPQVSFDTNANASVNGYAESAVTISVQSDAVQTDQEDEAPAAIKVTRLCCSIV